MSALFFSPSALLRLRMVLNHGQPVSCVFPLVSGQTLQLGQLLASTIEGDMFQDQIAAAALCRIVNRGVQPNGGVLWWLENGSDALVCRVDQQRLAHGTQIRLTEGTLVEIGLSRFVIESNAQPEPTSEDTAAASAAAPTPASAAQDAVRDARFASNTADAAARAAQRYCDFALTDLLLIEGAGTVLTGLAQQAPELDRPPAHETPAAPPGHQAATVPTEPANTADTVEVEAPYLQADSESQLLLERLHDEYLQLMRNPHDTTPLQDWGTQTALLRAHKQDILEDLTRSASEYDSLYTLLGETPCIEAVMAKMDTLSVHNLLEPEPHVNVLGLFAANDRATPAHALSDLTRREHHILSADSAAELGAHQPPTAPPGLRANASDASSGF